MLGLIPNIPISEFKKLKVHELKKMVSCSITSDGEYLFTFLNPQTDYIKVQVEYLAQTGNATGGKMPEELFNAPV